MSSYPTLAIKLWYDREKLQASIIPEAKASSISAFPTSIDLDLTHLRALAHNHQLYGQYIGQQLFSHPQIQEAWKQVVEQRSEQSIRLRLVFPVNEPVLHEIYWELLQLPDMIDQANTTPSDTRFIGLRTDAVIVRTIEGVLTSPPRPSQFSDLRALVVIADPLNLADFGMWSIDVDQWAEHARTLLGDCETTIIASSAGPHRPTFDTLVQFLHDGYDILYLVCHGSLLDGEAYLWLEGPDRQVALTKGEQLTLAIAGVTRPPRLVVLATCNSAGAGRVPTDTRALGSASLGLELSQHGVNAVIAMQGLLQLKSADAFFSTLFKGLFQHGVIDLAISEGRRAISQADWWVPTLFLQQQASTLWRLPSTEEIGLEPLGRDSLTGRVDERKFLKEALARGEAVLVHGPEGIGKRTLLIHLTRQVSETESRHRFWLTVEADTTMSVVMRQLITFIGRRTGRDNKESLQVASYNPLLVLDWVVNELRTLKSVLVFSDVHHLWEKDDWKQLLRKIDPLVQEKRVTLLMSAESVPDLPDINRLVGLQLTGITSEGLLSVARANAWAVPEAVTQQLDLVCRLTEGNPLRLQLLLRRLAQHTDPTVLLANLGATVEAEVQKFSGLKAFLARDTMVVLAALAVLVESPATREALQAVVGDILPAGATLEATLRDLCDAGIVRRIADTETTAVYRLRRLGGAIAAMDETQIVTLHRQAANYFHQHSPFFAALHLVRAGEVVEAAELLAKRLPQIIEDGHLQRALGLMSTLPLDTFAPDLAVEVQLATAELHLLVVEVENAGRIAAAAQERARKLTDQMARTAVAVRAALIRATSHRMQAEFDDAARFCQEQLSRPEAALLPPDLKARLYAELADTLYQQSKLEDALEAVKAGFTAANQGEAGLEVQARLKMRQATIASDSSDAATLSLLKEARDFADAADAFALLARIQYNLGLELDQRADGISAIATLENCRKLAERIGATEIQSYVLFGIGQHFLQRDEYETALHYLTEAQALAKEHGFTHLHVHTLTDIAVLHFSQEQYDIAQVHLQEAAVLCRQQRRKGNNLPRQMAIIELWQSEVALAQKRFLDARRQAERVTPLFQQFKLINYQAIAHRVQGDSFLASDQLEEAKVALEFARECDKEADDPYDHIRLLISLAQLAKAQGYDDEARSLLDEAQSCSADVSSRYYKRLVAQALSEL